MRRTSAMSPHVACSYKCLHTQAVGALGIVGATQLADLQGLNSLEDINGSLTIGFCPRIKNLKGLAPEGTSECACFSDTGWWWRMMRIMMIPYMSVFYLNDNKLGHWSCHCTQNNGTLPDINISCHRVVFMLCIFPPFHMCSHCNHCSTCHSTSMSFHIHCSTCHSMSMSFHICFSACAAIAAASPLSRFIRSRWATGRKLLAQDSTGGVRKISSEVWISGNPQLKDLTGLEVRVRDQAKQLHNHQDIGGGQGST